MEYEDRLTISTPEGVELELTLAGIGSRFTASLIDHLIQFAMIIGSALLLTGFDGVDTGTSGVEPDRGGSATLGIAVLTLFVFGVMFVYDVLFEVRAQGRTIGKRICGLRVVRDGGRPVGFVTSATRNILRLVDILPGFYGLGMAVMFSSSRNQRLGDIAAGTIVVRERKGGRAARRPRRRRLRRRRLAVVLPQTARDVARWDVSAVTSDEVATVRRFLERRGDLSAAPRADLAADLARRLRPKVAGAPATSAPEAFLEDLSAAKALR